VLKGLADAGIEFTDSERTSELGEHVSVLTPQSTKGLEFDAVITVEPARIIDEEVNGIRLLYVVLTRAVQALTVIHAEPLPRALAGQSG
jgi:DNA helicase IV